MKSIRILCISIILTFTSVSTAWAQAVTLTVDATDAARNLASAKNSTAPIEVVVEYNSFNETHKLNYHDGLRYPHLERDNSKPDVITDVVKSRAR